MAQDTSIRYAWLLIAFWIFYATKEVAAVRFGGMKTLVSLSKWNRSSFTFIQEDRYRPGMIITFLSHAIVEFNIDNPQNLQLVAGQPDAPGFSNGVNAKITFNNPWDLIQLDSSKWIISDSENNCLRDFNYQKNSQSSLFRKDSSISTWSADWRLFDKVSYIGHFVNSSRLRRPRGLTYVHDKQVVFVTYEEPYSLAMIYLRTNRITILYSSKNLRLRRIIAISSGVLISTEPPNLIFNYQVGKLEPIVDNQWVSKYSSKADSSEPFSASAAYIMPDLFILTASRENSLILVNRERKMATQICTGIAGHADKTTKECQLDTPRYIAYINNTLYIGENGWFGGGIRTFPIVTQPECVNCYTQTEDNGPVTTAIISTAVILLIGALAFAFVRYRKLCCTTHLENMQSEASSTLADRPLPPRPAPRPVPRDQALEIPIIYQPSDSYYSEISEERYKNSSDTRRNSYLSLVPPATDEEYLDSKPANKNTHSQAGNMYTLDHSFHRQTPSAPTHYDAYAYSYEPGSEFGYEAPDTIPDASLSTENDHSSNSSIDEVAEPTKNGPSNSLTDTETTEQAVKHPGSKYAVKLMEEVADGKTKAADNTVLEDGLNSAPVVVASGVVNSTADRAANNVIDDPAESMTHNGIKNTVMEAAADVVPELTIKMSNSKRIGN